ncbi:MAG: 2-oxoacid:acceptor oxidoreductase family protein [Kiritimatiellaeota bacterium]|nr:2-oxoacid:acceptor oxidoreductase family protein [Kiritimatiellota bacterium]
MKTTSVVIAGLGGQGVLTSADILAEAAFITGLDVKTSELHGMSQRGGSVTSDVRFGHQVFSPMVPWGQADCLVVLESTQVDINRPVLRKGGILITPDLIDKKDLLHHRSMNIALLGALSRHLPDIAEPAWIQAMRAHLTAAIQDVNIQIFLLVRKSQA